MKTKFTLQLSPEEFDKEILMGQSPTEHMKQLSMIHKTCYEYHTKNAHKKFFEERINDGNPYAPVNDILQQFVGVYFAKSVEIPPWFKTFQNDVIMWICDMLEQHNPEINEEIGNFDGDVTKLTKQAKKIIETIKELNHITPESFDEGKMNNGKKIIKSLISAIEVGIGKKDLAPENTNWYKAYEANKLQGGGKKVVISNTKMAKICLSSLFSGHSASSCQKLTEEITGNGSMNDALYNNVADENMLIMYEPGEAIEPYPTRRKEGVKKFTSMKWRTILRLIDIPEEYKECVGCGARLTINTELCVCGRSARDNSTTRQEPTFKKAIMMDTFYPSANDISIAYAIVSEIAKELGIAVVISNRSHYTQSNSGVKVDLKKGKSYVGSYGNIKAMSATEDCTKCSNNKKVDSCSSCVPFDKKLCTICKESKCGDGFEAIKCKNCGYLKSCKIKDCIECPWAKCRTFTPRAPYFDQLGGIEKFALCSDKTLSHMDTFYELLGVTKR